MRLESQRLYKGCCMMISRVKWDYPTPESEWIYVGLNDEFDIALAQAVIDERFNDPEILQVIDRRHTGPVATSESAESVRDHLKDKPVILCDRNFLSFVYFDANGLMRTGRVPIG